MASKLRVPWSKTPQNSMLGERSWPLGVHHNGNGHWLVRAWFPTITLLLGDWCEINPFGTRLVEKLVTRNSHGLSFSQLSDMLCLCGVVAHFRTPFPCLPTMLVQRHGHCGSPTRDCDDFTQSSAITTDVDFTLKKQKNTSLQYRIISHHITSYHIITHHVTSYHIISHHITSYHIITHHITSGHIISHHITIDSL